MAINKSVLGRGLASLLPESAAKPDKSLARMIPIDRICPSKNQPRKKFDNVAHEELVKSIKEKGLIQPIIVKENKGSYEIIAGERRWRACLEAGLKEIPIIMKVADEKESLELALIENIQRENLNSVEEARAYVSLQKDFGLTQNDIADKIGKNRTTVTNIMRILSLPSDVLSLVEEGKLSGAHARTLVVLNDVGKIRRLAKQIVEKDVSVRTLENLVKRLQKEGGNAKKEDKKSAVLFSLTEQLKTKLGTMVAISHKGSKGKIIIHYNSNSELERLVDLINTIS